MQLEDLGLGCRSSSSLRLLASHSTPIPNRTQQQSSLHCGEAHFLELGFPKLFHQLHFIDRILFKHLAVPFHPDGTKPSSHLAQLLRVAVVRPRSSGRWLALGRDELDTDIIRDAKECISAAFGRRKLSDDLFEAQTFAGFALHRGYEAATRHSETICCRLGHASDHLNLPRLIYCLFHLQTERILRAECETRYYLPRLCITSCACAGEIECA